MRSCVATAFCLQMQCYCHIAPLSSTLWVQPDSRRGQPGAKSPLSTSARLLAKQPQSLSSVHEVVKVCFCVTGIQYLFNKKNVTSCNTVFISKDKQKSIQDLIYFKRRLLKLLNCAPSHSWFMQKYVSLYFNWGSEGCQTLPQPFFVLKSRAVCRTRKIHSIKMAFKVRRFSWRWFVTDWWLLELHDNIDAVQLIGVRGRWSGTFN